MIASMTILASSDLMASDHKPGLAATQLGARSYILNAGPGDADSDPLRNAPVRLPDWRSRQVQAEAKGNRNKNKNGDRTGNADLNGVSG
jgi:hypothetical protein